MTKPIAPTARPLRRSLAPWLALLALLLVVTAAGAKGGPSPIECVLLTWDGAQAAHTQRLVEAGTLPRLAGLAATGARARWSQTAFPSKTAVGHAALFTGSFPETDGIVANQVPRGPDACHDVLDLVSGFDPAQLTAETFWQAAARQGKRTLVLYAPEVAAGLGGKTDALAGRLYRIDGYGSPASEYEIIDPSRVQPDPQPWPLLPRHEGSPHAFTFRIGETPIFGVVLDTVLDGRAASDTILLSTDHARTVTLSPSSAPAYTPPLVVRHRGDVAGVHFQLLSLGPDAGAFRLLRTSTAIERVNGSPIDAAYVRETGGFVGNGPSYMYRRGLLGPPFYEGGDGTAEARYLAAVRLICDTFGRKARYWVAKVHPQIVVAYLPYPDEALHTWLGVAERGGHGPQAWTCLETVFGLCDDFLGVFLDQANARTIVALASDHGMAGVDREFHPNAVLRDAGLLAVDAQGRPDLARTQILYGYEDGTFLRINRACYAHGVVTSEHEKEVLEKAVVALTAARDPDTGGAIVTGFYYPTVDSATFGIGGRRCGDVYLDLAPGLTFSASPKGPVVTRLPQPQGVHMFNPLRDDMHAIFYARGPGVPAGAVLAPVRIIQIVPTLCRLLGISPPLQAVGRPFDG